MIPKPTDAEVLLDAEKVGDYTLKPWTITKCCAMSPIIESIANELKKRKLSYRDFFTKTNTGFESINVDQLFFVITPFIPDVLRLTLDIKREEVDKIDRDLLMEFMAVIVRQNAGYLKNLFALIAQMNLDLKNVTI